MENRYQDSKSRINTNIKGRQTRKVKKIRLRFPIILILLVIIISLFANIFNSKTEATTKDVYDVILFFGQSNMVGCATGNSETRQGTTQTSKEQFVTKTGIEYDIVNNIVDRGSVKVPIQNGIAYEYLYTPTSDDGWYGSTRSYTTNGITYTWTNEKKNLRPIGWGDGFEGRYQTGENLTCSSSTGTISKVSQSSHLGGTDVNSELSYVTNMVPEFCRRYYEDTGRKVVAVVCAQGGKSIQYFAPGYSENGTSMHELMKRKFAAAVGYVQSKDDMQLGKCMFVSMQGENNCGNMTTDQYRTYYRQVVDSIKSYCGITNGALIETGHEIPTSHSLTGGVSMETLNTIHTAQEQLINNYSDTILGTDFPYQSFIPNTQTDYEQNCFTEVSFVPGYFNASNPRANSGYRYGYTDAIAQASLRVDYNTNSIHFTAASLCQVGRETADALATTISDGQVTLSSGSGSTEIGSQKSISVTYNKSGGNLWVASVDPTIASIDTSVLADSSQASQVNTNTSLLLNGTTIKINANKVGSTVIWVRSDANGAYKQAAAKYTITVTKKSLTPPTVTNTSKTYNGASQSPTYTGFDNNTMNVSGSSATNVGNYTISFSLRDTTNYQWSDGTTTNKTTAWSIGKKNLAIPTVTNTSKTYNGTAQSPTYTGFDGNTMNVSGNSATNVGNYTITFSLRDKTNYQWNDGTITNKSTSWSIGNSSITPPTVTNTSLTYNGEPQSPSYSGFDASTMNESGNRETNAGNYTITFSLRDKTNTKWSDGTTADKSTAWSIAKVTPSITLNPTAGEVNVGSTTTFTASKTSGAGDLDVTSSNESKATASISGNTITVTGVSAGSATITVSSEANTNYNATSATYSVTVKANDLTIPSLTNKTFTYDGSVKAPTVNGYDKNTMNQGGRTSATDVGTYVVTWSLKDPTNNKWTDGTTEQKTAAWSISAKNISSAVITLSPTSFEYDGTEKTPTITVKDGSKTLTKGTDYTVSYSNNLNVGTATLTITGTGNYTGTKSANYTITSRSIGNATITLSQSNYTYDGSAKEPAVTLKDGPATLTSNDYTVSYSNNVNPGTATVTVSGKGIYTGTKTANFTILGKDISGMSLTLSDTSLEYDGSAKEPTVTVKDGNTTLTNGTDYTVSYSNNVNLGTATATITGKGNYSGSKTANFTITAKNISGTTLTLGETSYEYDGSAKEPTVTVKDGSKTLTNSDYTVAYSNNTNPGTATVTISGKGNYTGTKTANYTITQRDISTATVSLSETSYEYDGSAKEPTTTVKIGNNVLTSNDYTVSYSNNVDAGTGTVTVEGKENCTGTKTANFTINKRTLNVRAVDKTRVYGEENPELTIEYNGAVKNQTPKINGGVKTDATVESAVGSYDIVNNDLALADNGTFKAGNYSLSFTKGTLTITGKNINSSSIELNPTSFEYDGTAKVPTVTVKDGSKTLTSDTDYTLAITNNTNAGTGTVTITGKGNYGGNKTANFTITAKDIDVATIELSETSYEYDGTAKVPTVTVKDGSKTLTKDTDYTLELKDNKNVGTATVTVNGKGNYGGNKTANFTITKRDLANATIDVTPTNFTYDGTAKVPTIVVKIGNSVLDKNTDYTLEITDNIDVGTGAVTVNGKGNCSGTKTANFTIDKRVLNVRAVNKTKVYGEANPELTIEYSGNVNEEKPKITGGVKTNATATSAVGSYDIVNNNIAIANNGAFKTGNYSLNFINGTLTVEAKDLSNFQVTTNPTSYTYDGTAKEPEVTIKDGNTTLTNGTDYTLSYSNNKNAGTATITITGKGNYKGTNTKGTFTITNKETDFVVTLEETSYVYDGTEKEPEVTVKDGNTTLTNGTDYTVNYSKNKNVGTAEVVITGKGNYSGSATEHFTITKKDFIITADNQTRTYGEANPELTYKYSGNAEGEIPSFSGTLETQATKTSNVGTYDITNGTIAVVDTNTFKGSNYNLTFAKGTLTIGKAEGKITLTDGENEEPEEGEVVVNCKRVIGINATGAVSAVSSKESVATVEVKNNKIEITGVGVGEAEITITSGALTNYNGTTRTYRVQVVPVALEKVEVKVLPKTSYIEGQDLEVTGGKLKLLFNNGVESEADITANMVTGYDKTRIGEQTLTVTYQGKETQYTVVVREKTVTKIEIETPLDKTTYIQNYEPLDLTGGKIKVYYDNGTTEILDITEEMISGFDNTKVGTNTIKVTYGGKESTYNVQIVEKKATEVQIIELPEVRTYVQDFGILDVTGGRIKVRFDDETEAEMDMTKEMITGFNNKNVGHQTLTVTIGGKTATYEVEVIDKVITKVEIEELPEKTEYTQNYDRLDLTGAKLKITYNDSYTDIINILPEMVSGFDNTKLGTNKIKVTYGDVELIFNVTIGKHKVVRTEVVKAPDKVEYNKGEKLTLTGGKVKIYYNDETSEVVDMEEEMLETGVSFETAGKKLVTLTIEGKDVSFEVDVKEEKQEENPNNGGNNNNNNSNNGNNQVDNTTAKTEIPQTGAEAWMIVLGVSVFVVFGGITTVKIFKNRDIK